MKHILFVDDEPNALAGLRRILRGMRHEWNITFVDNAQDALSLMRSQDIDIVVSDLHMPGIDGIELLRQIRMDSPHTVRIALSGHTDTQSAYSAVSQVHQYLSKPCEAEVLIDTLKRAIRLGSLLKNKRLQKAVSQMSNIPSISTVFDQVVAQLERPDASLRQIGENIARDAGMSAKILQLVNSAIFGLRQQVSNPAHATVLLGMETVRMLVLSVHVFDVLSNENLNNSFLHTVWSHCVNVARLSKRLALAELADERMAELAFLGGLLHDIGKLILASNLPAEYQHFIDRKVAGKTQGIQLERETFHATHGEVGAYLIGLWGFSDQVLEAIELHHEPGKSDDTGFTTLSAVYIANLLVSHQERSDAPKEITLSPSFDEKYLSQIGCTERFTLWQNMCRSMWEREPLLPQ